MAVKGNQRQAPTGFTKYVGLTEVEVRAINPTRSQLNKLLGEDDDENDKEIEYLSEDQDGNKRLRLTFWLYSDKQDKYFAHSFNLTQKERMNNDETKNQYINSVCITAWADDEANLPNWFTQFLNKEKEPVGPKKWKKAIYGEEELGTLLRTWLGRLNFNHPECEVLIDTDRLFKQDYGELRSLIESDFDTPFTILLGVRTDQDDTSKQYQQVWGKGFLPAGFTKFVDENGPRKNMTSYAQKTWKYFEEGVTGEYGFSSYYELTALKEYNPDDDPAVNGTGVRKGTEDVKPNTSRY